MGTFGFDSEELNRYSRHCSLPQFGVECQQKLKNARVLCVGAGGLGSPLLLYLTAAGVGTIGIVDHDIVQLSNLHRQILYSAEDINQKKVVVAKKKLAATNPHVDHIIYDEKIDRNNALSIISEYDIIADGTDNFPTRYLINDACFHLKKPNVYASIFQFEGQCSVFTTDDAPCYRCLYAEPPPPGLVPNCADGGVLGILPGVMGLIQATEVIKLIAGIGTTLAGRLLTYDALSMRFQEFGLQKSPDCRLCAHKQPFESLPVYENNICELKQEIKVPQISVSKLYQMKSENKSFVLLDVRELYEYEICHLDGKLIPLSQLAQRLGELDSSQLVVVHCKSGSRSSKAVKFLQESGFTDVRNLTGGILQWAKEIDPNMTTY